MKSLFSSIPKNIKKGFNAMPLFFIGLIVILIGLTFYDFQKGKFCAPYSNASLMPSYYPSSNGMVDNEPPSLHESNFQNNNVGNSQSNSLEPNELLPNDRRNLENQNFLTASAGEHMGINTTSGSLRNANLQLRAEPPNPKMNTGPWNLSTIDANPEHGIQEC